MDGTRGRQARPRARSKPNHFVGVQSSAVTALSRPLRGAGEARTEAVRLGSVSDYLRNCPVEVCRMVLHRADRSERLSAINAPAFNSVVDAPCNFVSIRLFRSELSAWLGGSGEADFIPSRSTRPVP